jgi:hypothetical protein
MPARGEREDGGAPGVAHSRAAASMPCRPEIPMSIRVTSTPASARSSRALDARQHSATTANPSLGQRMRARPARIRAWPDERYPDQRAHRRQNARRPRRDAASRSASPGKRALSSRITIPCRNAPQRSPAVGVARGRLDHRAGGARLDTRDEEVATKGAIGHPAIELWVGQGEVAVPGWRINLIEGCTRISRGRGRRRCRVRRRTRRPAPGRGGRV